MSTTGEQIDSQLERIASLEAENEALTATVERLQQNIHKLGSQIQKLESLAARTVSSRVC